MEFPFSTLAPLPPKALVCLSSFNIIKLSLLHFLGSKRNVAMPSWAMALPYPVTHAAITMYSNHCCTHCCSQEEMRIGRDERLHVIKWVLHCWYVTWRHWRPCLDHEWASFMENMPTMAYFLIGTAFLLFLYMVDESKIFFDWRRVVLPYYHPL